MTDLKPLSKVDQVLVKLLEAYPSLRQTRLDTIHDVMTGSEYSWDENGDVVVPKSSLERSTINWEERERNGDPRTEPSDILFARSEELKEHFVRDNAELIVRAGSHYRAPFHADYCSGFGFGSTMPRAGSKYLLCDSYTKMSNIPDNANPEWIAAFVEVFEEILRYRYSNSFIYSKRADVDSTLKALEEAKEEAREWLIRLKGTDTSKIELARKTIENEIAKLVKTAAQMGVTVEASVS